MKLTTKTFYLAQFVIWMNTVLVGTGYWIENERLMRGGFLDAPYQRVLTVIMYCGLAVCLYLQYQKADFKAAVLAFWAGAVSAFILVYNTGAHQFGIETLWTGQRGDPSVLTLFIIICHSIAFILLLSQYFRKVKLGFHYVAMVGSGTALLGHIIYALTKWEFAQWLYFDISGYSYGVAINTAVMGLVFGFACSVQLYRSGK